MTRKKLVKLLVDSQVTIWMLHWLKSRHPNMPRTIGMDILDVVISGVAGEIVGRAAAAVYERAKR